MTAHEAIASVPVAGTPDRAATQKLLIERFGYIVKDAENPADFDPQGESGTLTLVIGYQGKWFWYDPLDSSTAHDGVTTIVTTATGGRYKVDGLDYLVVSVADKDLAIPPVSPTIGDRYIVGAAATGDWATHDDEIAIYTARGWEFIVAGAGRLALVVDEAIFYHFSSGGSWTAGLGATPVSASSVPLSAAINFGGFVLVENQTTTAPPGSPTLGDAYIIGASATGDWTGHDLKIAICEDGVGFTIYTRPTGFRAYDKALNQDVQWNGTAWVSAGGFFTITTIRYDANDTWSKPAGLIGVRAEVYAAGGAGANAGGAGGSSSFGAHLSATGGGGGTASVGGAGGTGSGGDINLTGSTGAFQASSTNARVMIGGRAPGPHSAPTVLASGADGAAPGGGASAASSTGAKGGGGGGGYSEKWIDAADLASSEGVTVGAGGTGGGATGGDGAVFIHQYIAI